MKQNRKSLLKIIVVLTILFSIFSNIMFVYSVDFKKADDFLKKGSEKQGLTSDNLATVGKNFSEIGKVLVYIGAGVLVGGLAYIGILYMVSSPEKQAKLKEQLIGLLVAGIVIFGAYSIWSILVKILAGTVDS